MRLKTFNESKSENTNTFDLKLKINFSIISNQMGNWNVSTNNRIVLSGYANRGKVTTIDYKSKSIEYFEDELIKEVKKIIKKWQ